MMRDQSRQELVTMQMKVILIPCNANRRMENFHGSMLLL